METYVIKNDGSGKPVPFVVGSFGCEVIPACTVKRIDYNMFYEKFGVKITDYDIEYYNTHYSIWHHFIVFSPYDRCMIAEAAVKLTVTREDILAEFSDDEDWDVFFPYDKISKEGKENTIELCTSRFNYFWGGYFYFITKNGARKMITREIISQPVDEELLTASISGEINIYYSEMDWFEYNEANSQDYIMRNLSIKEAIFNHHAWAKETKEQAIYIMQHLSSVAEEMNLDLFLDAGTLLGAVRHGNIMPWDDDIDLAMDSRDIDCFIEEIKRRGVIEHCTWMWRHTGQEYHKFWLKSGQKTEGFPYLFPFIDIWVFFEKEDGYIYTCDGRRHTKEIFFPAIETKFEGCKLKLPHDYKGLLDVKYQDWKSYIKVYTWSHRVKSRAFKPLSLPITVDEKGRYATSENSNYRFVFLDQL